MNKLVFSMLLVALTGFIALSYEILWVRLYSFVSGSHAQAFGSLLTSYLAGLALGSLLSLRFQSSKGGDDPKHLRAVAGFVLFSNMCGFLLAPIVSSLVTKVAFVWTFPLVVFTAALMGATLPLICHFAISPDERAGARLSYLYVANIIGSGAGSLVTGFVLMDVLSMAWISVVLALFGLFLALGIYLATKPKLNQRLAAMGATVYLAFVLCTAGPLLFDGVYERLQLQTKYERSFRFTHVLESRYGVITVEDNIDIYGGGMYDGQFKTSLGPGDWIVRPYSLSAFHPAPKKVLVIGLSGGAWAQIIANNPHVEEVTVVEISKAYLKLVPQFDVVSSVLDNPKVKIVIDDGRRWMVRHPDERFDAIVMNTTWHWREHATHVLSREFMQIASDHLKPDGVMLMNATGSHEVWNTAMDVFPHTMMVLNNVLCSNQPIEIDKDRWRKTLEVYEIDGKSIFDLSNEQGRDDLERVLWLVDRIDTDLDTGYKMLSREAMMKEAGDARIITDDNLGNEYRWPMID